MPVRGAGASLSQGVIVAAFIGLVGVVTVWVAGNEQNPVALQAVVTPSEQVPVDTAEAERCKVPDFAKALGHEEKWKLHNNCK